MNLEFTKPQNLGYLLMKSSQSNFNLRSPGSYLVRSYLITTVPKICIIMIIVTGLLDPRKCKQKGGGSNVQHGFLCLDHFGQSRQ